MSFIHKLCGHFQECSSSSGNTIPECRPVNKGLSELFRQIGRTDTGREGEYHKVVHARSERGRGWEGREGWKEGTIARKYLERRRILCAVEEETAVLLSDAAVCDSGLETVIVAQRCGFTRCSSGSSSFAVLVSLTEILLEGHGHPLSGWCWRGACARREHVKYTLRCRDHFIG